MNSEVKKRLEWVKLYESVGNDGIVCLRCGITRPTLRKWLKRYKEFGLEGLNELSRRPHKIHYKITKEDEWILRFELCQLFRPDSASDYGLNDATLVV